MKTAISVSKTPPWNKWRFYSGIRHFSNHWRALQDSSVLPHVWLIGKGDKHATKKKFWLRKDSEVHMVSLCSELSCMH